MTVKVHLSYDDELLTQTFDTVTLDESGALVCINTDADGTVKKKRYSPNVWDMTEEVIDE